MRTEDGYIIQQCLDGNAAAFGFLVNKYKDPVYALAYSQVHNFHDAQDITQEVFTKAYRKLRDLRRWDNFMGWLCRITNNTCRNWLRAKARRPNLEFLDDQDPGILNRFSMDSYHENMVYEYVHYALDSLPELYSQVLVLRYFGGMTTREMSRFLAVSTSTIERRLREARTQLKEGMLTMMSKSYEQNQLPASFTFRMVEMVKRIKINPMPRMAGTPWGLSLAAGLIIVVLSLNPHLSILTPASFPTSSPLPVETWTLKTGEIPVDIVEESLMLAISGKRENIAEAVLAAETRVASNEGRIVFTQDCNGIWIMDADGGNIERLTTGDDLTPAWSPDKQQIAFSRYPDIYIMNPDGSNVRQLTSGPEDDYSPAWSPSGKQIAFNREVWDFWERKSCAIYVIDADGSDVKMLTESPPFFESPAWSPDGTKIAFNESFVAKAPRVWVMDADGGNQKMLNDWGEDPVWSPDGRRIAFSSQRDAWASWGSSDIYVMNTDGSDVKILTDPGPSNEITPRWSPDGESIAFCSDRDGNYNIYIMNADGSNVQQITNTPQNEIFPDWIAFSYAVEPADKLPTKWGEVK